MGNCDGREHGEEGLPEHSPQSARSNANPFFATQTAQANEHLVLGNYKFISTYDDKFMGRASVLEEKATGSLFLCKELVFGSEHECQEHYNMILEKKEKQEKCEDLLRVTEVFHKKVDGFFTDSSKVVMVTEYPLITLKREFNNRIINGLNFERDEITRILYSCIRGYAAIEDSGSINDKVRMAHVFVGVHARESIIKVVDSALLMTKSNLETMKKYGPSRSENYDIYMAPEQLQAYVQGRPFEHNPKSGVFSLGVTILDLCLMDSSRTIYYYQRHKISRRQIKKLVSIAGQRHGSHIERFLKEMLAFDPESRPSFQKLREVIPKVFNQAGEGNSLQLSVVKAGSSKLIDNDHHRLKESRASSMSVSSLGSMMSGSRIFTSSLKPDREEQQLQSVHEQYTNGNQYIGQVKKGIKHGKGKYIFKDRSYYEGTWKNGKMHGKGQLYLPNGRIQYNGEWKEDEPHGWGIYQNFEKKNGASRHWKKYEGEFFKGEMSGRGKLYLSYAGIYQGEFRNGKICGRGRHFDASGGVVDREWPILGIEEFVKMVAHEQGSSHISLSDPVFKTDNDPIESPPISGKEESPRNQNQASPLQDL